MLKPTLLKLRLLSKVTVAAVPPDKTLPKTAVSGLVPGTPPFQLPESLHNPPPLVFHCPLIRLLAAEITKSKTLPVLTKLNVSPLSEPG